jgi:hypothetical protein
LNENVCIFAEIKTKKDMKKQEIKKSLQEGKEIILDNEKTITDGNDFRQATCMLTEKKLFLIAFNGSFEFFKSFEGFFENLDRLKKKYKLEILIEQ